MEYAHNNQHSLGALEILPAEVWVNIFHQLPDLPTIMKVKEVCKTFRDLVEGNPNAFDTPERRLCIATHIHSETLKKTRQDQIEMEKQNMINLQLTEQQKLGFLGEFVDKINEENASKISQAYADTLTLSELFVVKDMHDPGLKQKMSKVLLASQQYIKQTKQIIELKIIQKHMNIEIQGAETMPPTPVAEHSLAFNGEDPSQLLAKKIITITQKRTRETAVTQAREEIQFIAQQKEVQLTEEKVNAMANDYIDQLHQAIIPQIIKLYADTYTLEELKLVHETWTSDLSEKLNQVALISRRLGLEVGHEIMPDLIQKYQDQ